MNSVGDRTTGHERRVDERPGGDPAVGLDTSRCSVVRFEKRVRECVRRASLTRVSGEA